MLELATFSWDGSGMSNRNKYAMRVTSDTESYELRYPTEQARQLAALDHLTLGRTVTFTNQVKPYLDSVSESWLSG
jgi:hypothetical protein